MLSLPPQTIISAPVQTAVCPERASGTSVNVGRHVSFVQATPSIAGRVNAYAVAATFVGSFAPSTFHHESNDGFGEVASG
jgi:hypothetical protein